MLVRFIVSNFMSFKNETEFNMLPASGQKRLKEHIYNEGGVDILKVGAIYGANGAGKSNLVKAVLALQEIIARNNFTLVKKFKLDKVYISSPTNFEIEFTTKAKTYSYFLSVSSDTILEESLYQTGTSKEILIFERKTNKGQTTIKMSDEYEKSEADKIRIKLYEKEFLKDNSCYLKLLAESKEPFEEIKLIFTTLTAGIAIIRPGDDLGILPFVLYNDEDTRKFLKQSICPVTGISDINVQSSDINSFFDKDAADKIDSLRNELLKGKNKGIWLSENNDKNRGYIPYAVLENDQVVAKEVISIHKDIDDNDVKFDIIEESDGTRRMLDILPWLFAIINHKETLIIDEIEQSIHVVLLKELISKFSKDNKTKGQLIFTTHESHLLDQEVLRQDEIWFAEKNGMGETSFYPLSTYDIRSDLDIRKGYLNGRFGAIPFIANLHDLNWEENGTNEK